MLRRLAVACGVLGAALFSCKETPVAPFKIVIHVESDPGLPLAGVGVLFQGKQVKTTDATGDAPIESVRSDGEEISLTVSCPPDTGPAEPIKIRIQRIEGAAATRFERACKPQIRSVAVVVRADNGPNLPVMYLGRQVARTDESGAAHINMKMRVGEAFNIMLQTDSEKIRPKNPVVPLTVAANDQVQLVNVRFEREKQRIIYRGKVAPSGPRQIP